MKGQDMSFIDVINIFPIKSILSGHTKLFEGGERRNW